LLWFEGEERGTRETKHPKTLLETNCNKDHARTTKIQTDRLRNDEGRTSEGIARHFVPTITHTQSMSENDFECFAHTGVNFRIQCFLKIGALWIEVFLERKSILVSTSSGLATLRRGDLGVFTLLDFGPIKSEMCNRRRALTLLTPCTRTPHLAILGNTGISLLTLLSFSRFSKREALSQHH
jgi:hypothetical protein